MKSDVTQGVYIVQTGSYILPNQAGREEERTGERDHHPAPEGCQNTRTIHPDRVAVAGEADNEPSENKKDSVPKEHLGSKHGTLELAPDSEDRSLHRLIGKMQTLKKALLVYVLATTQERPAWVFVR